MMVSKTSLIAYLEKQGYRSAGGPAAVAPAAGNPVQRLGSLEALAASLHTGDSWDLAGVTLMTPAEPRNLFSPL